MTESNTSNKKIPTVLIILDGFGLADETKKGNAITSKTAPNVFSYMKQYPSTQLVSSGIDVGLFPGQPGNSEAGHLNIGAGRIVKQDLVLISEAIAEGEDEFAGLVLRDAENALTTRLFTDPQISRTIILSNRLSSLNCL